MVRPLRPLLAPRPARGEPRATSGREGRARALLLVLVGVLPAASCASSSAPADAAIDAPQAPAPPDLAPEAARLASDVAWLADDAREGRRAGMPGAIASADWIAARLASLGLEPAGEDGGWFQAFPVDLPVRDGGGSRVHAPRASGGASDFEALSCAPLSCSEGGEVDGPLVFAGYGIQREQRDWDDYAGLDVKDAVVLVVRGTPRIPDPPADPNAPQGPHGVVRESPWGDSGAIFFKVMEAKRRGARAVVIAQHPAATEEPLLRFDPGETARAGIPAVMIGAADAAVLVPGYADLVQAYDQGQHPSATAAFPTLTVHADVVRRQGTARNVLARLAGAAPGRTVVLGAHFDHLGYGGIGSLAKDRGPAIHNGADDNASGTALVLELARILSAGPKPGGDVVFALWSGEELGLLGSAYWTEHPTIPLDSLRCNLNFDMVGRADQNPLDVLGAGTSTVFPALVRAATAGSGLEVRTTDSGQGVGGSDHQSFLARRIPALHFFTGLHPQYHTPDDDAALFEADGAARVAALALRLLREVQAAPELAWTAPPQDESEHPSRRGWTTYLGSRPEYSYSGKGVLLSGTSDGSPAQRAGLITGDVLTGMGEVEIDGLGDLVYALKLYKPGDVVRVSYLRDGQPQTVQLTLLSRERE